MNLTSKEILLHLSLITGVGPSTVLQILKNYSVKDLLDNKLQEIYKFSTDNFIKKFNISSRFANLLCVGLADKNILDKELSLIKKYNIDYYTFLDSDYPESLKNIYMPPIVIYCKGQKIDSFEKNIAVVGSRKADDYAQKTIESIVPVLVENGYTIVSGGALGADSMAHKQALKSGGKTVVVLGAGLLHPYPDSNKELFRSIVRSGGTLVSCFSLDTHPNRFNFPARNRIISGLAKGCLVVQAARKSGALITANHALEEGRSVFAIPGSIYDELSLGCHDLIAQGAKLVNTAQDILIDFGHVLPETNNIKNNLKSLENKNLESKTIDCKNKLKDLDPVLSCLQSPCSMDEISCQTNLDMVVLQQKLFDMQLDGLVKQNFAGLWEKL